MTDYFHSDILRFVAGNLAHLQPVDYVLLFVTAALLACLLGYLIYRVYNAIIAAQQNLIAVQDRTIRAYEVDLGRLRISEHQLAAALEATNRELAVLRNEHRDFTRSTRQSLEGLSTIAYRFYGLLLLANSAFLLYEMATTLKEKIWIYRANRERHRMMDLPVLSELIDRLEHIIGRADIAVEQLRNIDYSPEKGFVIQETVSRALEELNAEGDQIIRELDEINLITNRNMRQIIATHNPTYLERFDESVSA